jgi:hypothetical protein
LKRVEQKIAQRSALDLRPLPGARHPARMIVKDRSVSVGKARTTKVRPVVGPEGIDQTGSFQRGQSRVLVEV